MVEVFEMEVTSTLLSLYIKDIVEDISAVHFTKAKRDVKLKDF